MGNKKNIRAYALSRNTEDGSFDIYLDFSGQREYLVTHRENHHLYGLLRHGICIDDIERSAQKSFQQVSLFGKRYLHGRPHPRLKSYKNRSCRLEKSVQHLMLVIEDYIAYRDWEPEELAICG